MTLIEAVELRKSYHTSSTSVVEALQGATVNIECGTCAVITGPSGSGKSTLLAILGALERPTAGRAIFDGTDLSRCSGWELTRIRRRMGFIFQNFSLIPNLTALENITYPLIARGLLRSKRIRYARDLLTKFGLESRVNSVARGLSGGEQQRVAIARALAGEPEAVLADEPTSNLDPGAAEIVYSTLGDLRHSGRTVVVATHDPQIVDMADVVHRLRDGRMD